MFKVKELPARYEIVRSALYSRMKALKLTSEKVGNCAYLSADQVALLDDLDQFIAAGGTTREFITERFGQSPQTVAQKSSSPLDMFRQLEEVVFNGWILGASQLRQLLGAELPQVEEFSDAGFLFQRAGNRLNGEPGWKVLKPC